MYVAAVFVIGVSVGFIAQRYAFCILGSLVELFAVKRVRQMAGVLAAMLVFALVRLHGAPAGAEQAAAVLLAGGLIQGVGYYLASGCTLGLLVRLGEGSKAHLIVLAGFVGGAALYETVLKQFIATVSR